MRKRFDRKFIGVGHNAFVVDYRRASRYFDLPDYILIKIGSGNQCLEVPVKRLGLRRVRQLPHTSPYKDRVAGILDIYSKVSRLSLCHILRVGPGLIHSQAVSLEISDNHLRIGLCADRSPNALCRGRSGSLAVQLISLEGVSVRDLGGRFHCFELRPCQNIAHLDRVIHRDLRDRAVNGCRKGRGLLLFFRQIIKIGLSERFEFLRILVPSAVV